MSKRNLCQWGTMFLLGMGWRIYHKGICFAGGIVLLLFLWWHVRVHMKGRPKQCLVFLLAVFSFALGAYRGQMALQREVQRQSFLSQTQTISFQGEIYKKDVKSDRVCYYLQNVILQSGNQQMDCPSIILYPESDDDSLGTIYQGTAQVCPFRKSRNEGNFDELRFYQSQDIVAKLVDVNVTKKGYVNRPVARWRERLKEKMLTVFLTFLHGEESGLLATMVLGDKRLLEDEAKDLFQLAGLAHLMAISGLHISLVGNVLYKVARKCGFKFWSAGTVAGVIITEYALLCGMGKPTMRALLMYLLFLLAEGLGRTYDSLNGLCLAAVIIAWDNPFCLFHTGCIFSFVAAFGMLTVGKSFAMGKKRFTGVFRALGLQLVTLPVVAAVFYEIPLYAFFLNLLLLPMMGPLLGSGLLGGLLGIRFEGIAKVSMSVCHTILFLWEKIAAYSLQLPGTRQIMGCPQLWKIIVYESFILSACYLMRGRWRKVLLVLLAVIFLWIPSKKEFEIDVLDVGQGDAIFIQTEEGVTFFIDGGSTDIDAVGTYRILPFLKYRGIKRINYWFVSHTDLDHISGLQECMEQGYPIDCIVFSRYVVKDEKQKDIVEVAKAKGITVAYLQPGGVCKTKTTKVTCLYPMCAGTDTNANSMALLLERKDFRALFTGDLGIEEEIKLPYQQIGMVDFFKAGHHGSDGSNGEQLLSCCHPQKIVVSCAKKNTYGHPGKAAVERMKKEKSQVFYTMYGGQIKLIRKGNRNYEVIERIRYEE